MTEGIVIVNRNAPEAAPTSIAKRILVAVALAALSLAAMPLVHAESRAQIIDTQPSRDATLGRNESFYVRIEYATDEPISLWARPYRDGKPVEKAMSNASARYTGTGEALGWFALIDPGAVDEIRIRAGGGKPYREWELAREPVRLQWTAADRSRQRRQHGSTS